jgi:TP901 family phage tail tape measure protein
MAAFTPAGVELIVKNASGFFGTLDKAAGKVGSFGATIGKAAVAGVAALGAAVIGVGAMSLKAAIDFETAFAGVIKTTDGLVDEFGNLTQAGTEVQQGFRDLAKEIPTSVEELLRIGELGGQLGIARENLVDFTRVIAAMGEATNLTTEEAATGFAQLANIMQTPQDQIENMGSSIVALGNNFATTERDVLAFAQRIAGAGQIAGLTEAQVFGIGAAMSSVGIQAEAGGTAVQKVLLAMNQAAIEGGDQMEIFAAVAGMSAEDFGTAWEEDAGVVFNEFVNGLGLAGDDAINILSALGMEDQRLMRSFLSLAGAGDLLTEAMDLSTDAFAENTALTKEAEARYRTTAAQFGILKNQLKDVAITIGQALLPFLNKLLKAAMPLVEEFGKRLPGAMEKVTAFINKVAGAVSLLFKQFQGFGLKGFFSTFEDGSTIIGGFLKRLGVGEKVAEQVGRTINKLAQFLMKAIPAAVKFASNAWTNVLQPALATIWQFIANTLVPALTQLFNWLSVNIPIALQILSDFWNNILLPAIQTVWAFIQNTLLPAFQAFADFLISTLGPVVQEIATFIVEQFQSAVGWVVENWPLIQETIQTVLEFVQGIVQAILGAIQEFWTAHGAQIVATATQAWETVKSVIDTVANVIRGIIELVMLAIAGDWTAFGEVLKTITQVFMEGLQSIVDLAMTLIKMVIQIALDAIRALFVLAWNAIKAFLGIVLDAIKLLITTAFRAIRDVIKFLLDSAKTIVTNIWDAIKKVINDAMEKVKEFVTKGFEAVLNFLSGIVERFKNAGKAIVNAIRDGIAAAWGGLVDWFKGKLKGLTDLLPFSLPRDPTSPLRKLPQAGAGYVDEIMKGMARQMPALQAQLTTALMPQQTMAPIAGGAAGGTTNMVNVNMGGVNITSGMDQVVFEERVRTVVRDAIGET